MSGIVVYIVVVVVSTATIGHIDVAYSVIVAAMFLSRFPHETIQNIRLIYCSVVQNIDVGILLERLCSILLNDRIERSFVR